ncbi:hypothetical protein JXA85_06505, partial [Candidatus Woesearchaeota archaeon]|nr:hypothetical protein [Candidatus Woesearchaeota archaeon]
SRSSRKMIKLKRLKIYIEDMDSFYKKAEKELKAIEDGKAKTLEEDSLSFQSLNQAKKFFTPKRLELLKAIRHNDPESIYALAKMVRRTSENVNTDVKLLKQLGFVEITKTKDVRKKTVPRVNYDRLTLEIPL